MKSRYIDIDSVGTVLFETSKRAKHLNISVRPNNRIRVAIPRRVSLKKALEFVHRKTGWIQRKIEEYAVVQQEHKDFFANKMEIDRAEARKQLISRLNSLAREHGFRYNKVFIRNQKTRWGSCSAKNNINLNYKLMLLPQHLRDHVILHELVHTKHRNHSPRFWKELERIDPKTIEHNNELRQFHISLL